MRCSGCRRELEVGDQYIQDTASGFMDREPDGLDDLMAEILGAGHGDKIVYCEDCTVKGDGRWLFETVYGDVRMTPVRLNREQEATCTSPSPAS